jgi:hypothetical protein
MGTGINIKLTKSINRIIKDSGINDNAALFAAKEARKLMNDYVPMKTGALSNTAQIYAGNSRGVVVYNQPYAKFCYYGEKQKFNRDKHEKASAFWDKAMMSANKGVLTERVNRYIKNKK